MTHVHGSDLDKPVGDRRSERRARMRQFQSQLLDRMQVAREHRDVNISQLAVVIGNVNYLIKLHESGEIVSIGQLVKVPLTQEWYLGLLNIRGNLVGVVDFQRFQGQPALEITQDSRVVGFSPTLGFNCGFLVSKVLGLRNVADMDLKELSSTITDNWLGKNYIDGDNQRWVEVNLSNLVRNVGFLHIGL